MKEFDTIEEVMDAMETHGSMRVPGSFKLKKSLFRRSLFEVEIHSDHVLYKYAGFGTKSFGTFKSNQINSFYLMKDVVNG